jgi:hypothetical protein
MCCIRISDVLIPANRSNPRSGFVEAFLRFSQYGFVIIYIKLYAHCPYECFVHKDSVAERTPLVKESVPAG